MAGRLVLPLFLAAALASRAHGEGSEVWAARPTRAEIVAAVPQAVRAAGGRVVLRCKADASGALSGCTKLAETPAGSGAAEAIARLAPRYRLTPEAAGRGEATIVADWFEADTAPRWRRRPSPAQLQSVWPSFAWTHGIEGRTEISCLISTAGALYDCVAISQSPPVLGFGAAALALTPQLQFWPARRHGRPTVAAVTFPVDFLGPGGSGDRGVGQARPRPSPPAHP